MNTETTMDMTTEVEPIVGEDNAPKSRKKLWITGVGVLATVALAAGGGVWWHTHAQHQALVRECEQMVASVAPAVKDAKAVLERVEDLDDVADERVAVVNTLAMVDGLDCVADPTAAASTARDVAGSLAGQVEALTTVWEPVEQGAKAEFDKAVTSAKAALEAAQAVAKTSREQVADTTTLDTLASAVTALDKAMAEAGKASTVSAWRTAIEGLTTATGAASKAASGVTASHTAWAASQGVTPTAGGYSSDYSGGYTANNDGGYYSASSGYTSSGGGPSTTSDNGGTYTETIVEYDNSTSWGILGEGPTGECSWGSDGAPCEVYDPTKP